MTNRSRDREEVVEELGALTESRRRNGEVISGQAAAAVPRSLVVRFGRARQSGQVSERFLDLCWDRRRGGKMRAVRLVTVLVGYVTGLDGLTVGGNVGHGSLEHGHRSFGAGLQVGDLLLLDTVVGLETETFRELVSPKVRHVRPREKRDGYTLIFNNPLRRRRSGYDFSTRVPSWILFETRVSVFFFFTRTAVSKLSSGIARFEISK